MNDTIVIGKIVGVHGILGEIKVFPLTDDPERFYDLDYFLCEDVHYHIESVRGHQGHMLIKAKELSDRTEAQKLRGHFLQVYRTDAVELAEGEYFVEDLKGLKAYDTSSEQTAVIKDIIQAGAVDVIWFDLNGKDLLIPYLNEYVSEVNIKEGYMKIDFTKGVLS